MVKKIKTKKHDKQEMTPEEKKERDSRTVFVGNIAVEATLKQVKRFFKSNVGKVDAVRFRSICTI